MTKSLFARISTQEVLDPYVPFTQNGSSFSIKASISSTCSRPLLIAISRAVLIFPRTWFAFIHAGREPRVPQNRIFILIPHNILISSAPTFLSDKLRHLKVHFLCSFVLLTVCLCGSYKIAHSFYNNLRFPFLSIGGSRHDGCLNVLETRMDESWRTRLSDHGCPKTNTYGTLIHVDSEPFRTADLAMILKKLLF